MHNVRSEHVHYFIMGYLKQVDDAISFVYEHNDRSLKESLWETLDGYYTVTKFPSILLVDFNIVLSTEDRISKVLAD